MKNNHEMYQSVLSRRDEYRRKKERRMLILKRTAPVLACCCIAGVFGLHAVRHSAKIPDIPIVTETVTTISAETGTSVTITAATTSESVSTTRTATSSSATSSSAVKTATSQTSAVTSQTLTVKTPSAVTDSESTGRTSAQTSEKATQKQTTATKTEEPIITTTAIQSDLSDNGNMSFTVTQNNEKPSVRTTSAEQMSPGMNPSTETQTSANPSDEEKDIYSFSYQGLNYRLSYRTVDGSELTGNIISDTVVVYDNIAGKEKTVPLKMFTIRNISDKIAVVIKGNDMYLLYTSDLIPESMQTLFDEIALPEWKIYSITYAGNQIKGFDDQAIFDTILSLPDITDGPCNVTGKSIIIIMNHDVLGSRRILLTEYGDLICDQAGISLTYHIGEENINKLKELIL